MNVRQRSAQLPRFRRCGFCRHPAWLTVLLILCLGLASSPASAQTSRRHAQDPIEQLLRTARTMLRQGQPEHAIRQLERLAAEEPTDRRVTMALAAAYIEIGQHDNAARIYRAEIDRTKGGNSELWQHLVSAYQLGGRGASAVNTLLEILGKRPGWFGRFADQFELVVTDSICGEIALEALEMRVEGGGPSIWREALAHVRVVSGELAAAITMIVDLDREEHAGGQRVLNLARTLAERGDADAALAAYDSVLTLVPTASQAEAATLEKAAIHEELGQIHEAAQAYDRQVQQFPSGPRALRARLRRAALLMGPLDDLGAARAAYVEVLSLAESSQSKNDRALRGEVLLALGECALRAGDFEEADTTFSRLEREGGEGQTSERAAFEHAEILFYQGRFLDAEQAYYALTDRYQTGSWVNDALSRALLLGEFGNSAGPALTAYAQALYQRRIGNPADALETTKTALADTLNAPLRGHLRLEEIQLSGELGFWAQADSSLALLLAQDPESRTAPVALYWMATEAEEHAERRTQASALYEDVILRYPDSLEARRARPRLRTLREKGQS